MFLNPSQKSELLQILVGQSWLFFFTVTTDLGLEHLYTGFRTTPSQAHTGLYLMWPFTTRIQLGFYLTLARQCWHGQRKQDERKLSHTQVVTLLELYSRILFASTEVMHRSRSDSRLHSDIMNTRQIRVEKQIHESSLALGGVCLSQPCSPSRATWMATGLLRQDHGWIATDQFFRFHEDEFDKMLCKLNSTEYRQNGNRFTLIATGTPPTTMNHENLRSSVPPPVVKRERQNLEVRGEDFPRKKIFLAN